MWMDLPINILVRIYDDIGTAGIPLATFGKRLGK